VRARKVRAQSKGERRWRQVRVCKGKASQCAEAAVMLQQRARVRMRAQAERRA